MLRKFFSILICLFLAVLLCPAVYAEQSAISITSDGYAGTDFLTDGNVDEYKTSSGPSSLTITSNSGDLGSLYLMFDLPCGKYTVTDNTNNTSFTAGAYG